MFFFFSSRRRHTRCSRDWSSDVCSSDLPALPDTNEFTLKPYHTRFSPDYVARPTIGYERDNFGRGFFGGTAILLSDMLGDRKSTRLNSSHGYISYAVFCLKKKKNVLNV